MPPGRAPREADKPNYPIGSVDSALRLLLLIGQRGQIRIAEASREINVARSTAHRLMQMLQYHGFVRQNPESKAYEPGPVLVSIGLQVVRDFDVRTVARPLIEALADETGETVHLIALQERGGLCVDSVESTRVLRVGSRVGVVLPLYATAAGRAILAAMPAEEARRLVPRGRLPRLTETTVASRSQLEEELARTRERGYAVNRGEFEEEVSAVAAPIVDSRGQASFAVTVAVPAQRLTDDDVPRIGAAVVSCAKRIAAALPR